ncbi:hypothetical protein TNCV_1299501, partial [Trichonephila clavipes]
REIPTFYNSLVSKRQAVGEFTEFKSTVPVQSKVGITTPELKSGKKFPWRWMEGVNPIPWSPRFLDFGLFLEGIREEYC